MRTYPLFISIAFATTCAASTSSHAVTTNAVTVTSDTPALPTRKLASGDETLNRSNLRSAYGFSDLNDKDEARMMSVQVAHEIPSVLPAAKQIEIEAGMAKMHTKLPEEEMNLLVNAVVNRKPIKLQDFQKNALEDRLVEKVDSAVMPYDDLMLETKLTTYSNNEELLKDITTVLPKAAKGDKHNPQATVRALLEEDSLKTTNKIEESAERTELLKSFPKLEYAPSLTTETLQNMKTLLNRAEKETTGRKVGDKSKPDGLSRNPSSEVSHVGRQDDAVNIFNGRVLGSTIPLSLNAENKLVVAMISPTTLDKYVPMLPKGGLLEKESSLGGSLREVKEEAGVRVAGSLYLG